MLHTILVSWISISATFLMVTLITDYYNNNEKYKNSVTRAILYYFSILMACILWPISLGVFIKYMKKNNKK